MTKNVGTIDRVVRGLAGIAAIGAYSMGVVSGTWGIVALVAGVVLLGTAAIAWCPPYTLFGINTCGTKTS